MLALKSVIFCAFLSCAVGNSAFRDECTIDIKSDNPSKPPLLTSDVGAWVLPGLDDNIHLQSGTTLRLACPGFGFEDSQLKDNLFWTAKCIGSGMFEVEGISKDFEFDDLGCAEWPDEIVDVTDVACGSQAEAQEVTVKFETANGFFNDVFITCINFNTYQSLWSKHVLHKEIGQRTGGGNMPQFVDDNLYDFEVYVSYTKVKQTETVAVLVGSQDLAEEYIQSSGNVYMARGHLAPKADFQFTSWQRATYHYINVQPQWQVFNGGNWVDIENALREYVEAQQKDHIVITGGSGVIELENIEGNKVDIYLNIDNPEAKLAVPRFYWKLVLEPEANLGVVLIGVNNPHLSANEVDNGYRICDPIPNHPLLDKVNNINDIREGVVYACSVEDAQNVIPEIPKDILVDGILGG